MNKILNYNNKVTRIHIVALILLFTSILPMQAQVDELINMNLSAGAVNVTVPIYTYKTRNLSLPISLSYTPIYTQSPHPDLPSEGHVYQAGFVGLGWSLKTGGMIRRIANGIPDEIEQGEADEIIGNLYNMDESYNPKTAKATDLKYDIDEDQFVFNFGEYSGMFFFYRGKWIISSDQKIEISYFSWHNKLEGFVMETPDGITYTFGNYGITPSNPKYDTAVELTSSSSSEVETVTAWHLIKIESPEGDQINFSYGYETNESPTNSQTPVQQQITLYTKRQTFDIFTNKWLDDVAPNLYKTIPTDDEVQNGSVYTQTTQVYLQSITSTSNPIVINFHKSPYDEMYYDEYTATRQAYKLDKVSFSKSPDNNNFKEFNLQYTGGTRSGQTGEFLQLSTIQESGRETVSQPLSSLPPYSFTYYSSTDANSPDALEKITSPLGGSAKFEYIGDTEGRRYLAIKKTVKSSDNDDELISEYAYQGFQNSRAAVHQKTDMTKPFVLNGDQMIQFICSRTTKYDCAAPSDIAISTVPANIKTYTSVVETIISHSAPNILNLLGSKEYKFRGFRSEYEPDKLTKFYQITDVGAPLSVRHINADYQLISNQTFEYEDLDAQKSAMLRYYSSFLTFKDGFDTEKSTLAYGVYSTYQSRYVLSKLTEETPSNTRETSFTYHPIIGKVKDVTTTETNYDDKSVLKGIQQAVNPKYRTQTTSYTYSVDFENWWGANEWDLSSCHRQLDLPVEKITKKDGNIVAVELTTYQTIDLTANHKGNSSYLLRPWQSYRLEIPTAIAASDYTPLAADWSTLDSKLKLHSTYTYDTMGDLIQVQSLGQPVQSFVYDANSGLPILKAIGLSHDDLMGYKTSQGLNLDNIEHINKIRKNFPISQVSSYTYHPKFGIQSISTPNGISFSKEYDAFGRTKVLKDNNSNILKAFEYNNNIQ